MIKIRLARVGAKKQPKYRIVVIDEREKRNGRFIEIVGHYDPVGEPPPLELKKDRIDYWLSVGAQLSKAADNLFKRYEKTNRISR